MNLSFNEERALLLRLKAFVENAHNEGSDSQIEYSSKGLHDWEMIRTWSRKARFSPGPNE